jgi:hypothetical protein
MYINHAFPRRRNSFRLSIYQREVFLDDARPEPRTDSSPTLRRKFETMTVPAVEYDDLTDTQQRDIFRE